jgi:hypothetical protein
MGSEVKEQGYSRQVSHLQSPQASLTPRSAAWWMATKKKRLPDAPHSCQQNKGVWLICGGCPRHSHGPIQTPPRQRQDRARLVIARSGCWVLGGRIAGPDCDRTFQMIALRGSCSARRSCSRSTKQLQSVRLPTFCVVTQALSWSAASSYRIQASLRVVRGLLRHEASGQNAESVNSQVTEYHVLRWPYISKRISMMLFGCVEQIRAGGLALPPTFILTLCRSAN